MIDIIAHFSPGIIISKKEFEHEASSLDGVFFSWGVGGLLGKDDVGPQGPHPHHETCNSFDLENLRENGFPLMGWAERR